MTFELAQTLLKIGGYCFIAHFAFSFGLHLRIKSDELHQKIFAFPPFGPLLAQRPWQMQSRFFWPWVPAPSEFANGDVLAIGLFWMARLAAFLAIVAFITLLIVLVQIFWRLSTNSRQNTATSGKSQNVHRNEMRSDLEITS
jgi:hypothetical protein